jgi:hypothetical protein
MIFEKNKKILVYFTSKKFDLPRREPETVALLAMKTYYFHFSQKRTFI